MSAYDAIAPIVRTMFGRFCGGLGGTLLSRASSRVLLAAELHLQSSDVRCIELQLTRYLLDMVDEPCAKSVPQRRVGRVSFAFRACQAPAPIGASV